MKFRTMILGLALALCSTAALADIPDGNGGPSVNQPGGNGGPCQAEQCTGGAPGTSFSASGYAGSALGTFTVGTNGGSMAQTGIYQNGEAWQFSNNSGSAYAGGGAAFSQDGFIGGTFGGSTSQAYSTGYVNGTAGDYVNSTAGGVGSNYSATVTGTWTAVTFSGFGGPEFAGFGGW